MQIHKIFVLTPIEAPFGATILEKWVLSYGYKIGLIIESEFFGVSIHPDTLQIYKVDNLTPIGIPFEIPIF